MTDLPGSKGGIAAAEGFLETIGCLHCDRSPVKRAAS